MKTHILIGLFAIILSACASKRDIASTTQDENIQEETQHAQMIDAAASGRGNSIR